MFIKPNREPIDGYFGNNQDLLGRSYLQRDIRDAPKGIIRSLKKHCAEHHINIVPVINKSVGISFQFSGHSDFIVRDIGYSSLLVKTLLDLKFENGFYSTVESICKKLSLIEHFIYSEKPAFFSEVMTTSFANGYSRSIVVGLKKGTSSIQDIEYVDIYFDSKPDVVPIHSTASTKNKTMYYRETKEVKEVKRTGLSLRLYLTPTPATYHLEREFQHCTSTYGDVVKVDSYERHLSLYYCDIDSLAIKYIEYNKPELEQRLGFSISVVDKDILNVVEMNLI
jgi:hypothetical protein